MREIFYGETCPDKSKCNDRNCIARWPWRCQASFTCGVDLELEYNKVEEEEIDLDPSSIFLFQLKQKFNIAQA